MIYDDYLHQSELQRWILEADVAWSRIDVPLARQRLRRDDVRPIGQRRHAPRPPFRDPARDEQQLRLQLTRRTMRGTKGPRRGLYAAIRI